MKYKLIQPFALTLAAASFVCAEPQKAGDTPKKNSVVKPAEVKKVKKTRHDTDASTHSKHDTEVEKGEDISKFVAGPVWWWNGEDLDPDPDPTHGSKRSLNRNKRYLGLKKWQRLKFVHYDPENDTFTTSTMTKDRKASKRIKEKTGHALTLVRKESTEVIFSWKQNKKIEGQVALRLYALNTGKEVEKVDSFKAQEKALSKPMYSSWVKGNSASSRSFAKSLKQGVYLWTLVAIKDGEVIGGSNPEMLAVMYSDSDKEAAKPIRWPHWFGATKRWIKRNTPEKF